MCASFGDRKEGKLFWGEKMLRKRKRGNAREREREREREKDNKFNRRNLAEK